MDKLIKKLKKMVDKHGPALVAAHLGQSDTQNLKRWIRDQRMPPHLVSAIEAILEIKGDIK